MADETRADTPTPLDWTGDGQPRSRLFGDVYFSAEDGLAEARAVFLEGCGLPDAWKGRRRFVVAELGFGTGLNVAALIELWSRARPPGGLLHIFSAEAYPISADEARRALARWPEIGWIAERLVAGWPGQAVGPHRLEMADLGVILDVAIGEAAAVLAGWSGLADAWFLDGFAPSLNPAIWRDEVLALVAARSAPGAAAATFTVAGQVRRGLAAAGFEVEKRPGFGKKRERLAARLPGVRAAPAAVRRVAIVGAGVAGAAAARAVAALGGEALVFDAVGLCAGASGNPTALVTPRLDAGLGPPARLFAQAFRRAVALYEAQPDAIVGRGALQVATQPRDAGRFARVAASALFEPGSLRRLEPQAASDALGEPAPEALDVADGLTIEPRRALAAWAPAINCAAVARIEPAGAGWRLLDAGGAVLGEADAVIVAAGLASAGLVADLPLSAVRGQASWTRTFDGSVPPAAAFGGYVLPLAGGGLLFGATHDRGDTDCDLRPGDHARNLQSLAEALPALAARVAGRPLEGRAAIRVATPDRLPVAGAAPEGGPGLFVLSGFGGRGFTLAPLLAEHVAAQALGAPSPLASDLAAIVNPARFRLRQARRS
jgi:tRNA 5-methylaminomethyl-2-thiouridine biosynthesis bifunctional protein